jgi:hypothetical protein
LQAILYQHFLSGRLDKYARAISKPQAGQKWPAGPALATPVLNIDFLGDQLIVTYILLYYSVELFLNGFACCNNYSGLLKEHFQELNSKKQIRYFQERFFSKKGAFSGMEIMQLSCNNFSNLIVAFHACVGGCNGCLNLNQGDNNGLGDIVAALETLYQNLGLAEQGVSRADFWSLAGTVAVEIGVQLANG